MPNKLQILPFLHERLGEKILLVNVCGDHVFATNQQLDSILSTTIDPGDPFYLELKSKHFICDRNLEDVINFLAIKFRSKKSFLRDFTSLHMMVITLRCNHRCEYCQVSSESEDAAKWDMQPQTAKAIIDVIFQSPSQHIKIEFQGGEPLLNWQTLKVAIEYAEAKNIVEKRHLEFVICTNLYALNDEILQFIKDRNVCLSTSLDGPQEIHDGQRIVRSGASSYEMFVRNLEKASKVIGQERISALMTTTKKNINRLPEVIDEYIRLGFRGIFLRDLNPYGFAADNRSQIGYDIHDFVEAYKSVLDHLIALNIGGTFFAEYHTVLLLQRILTPFGTGFVDLQSPSGAGISGVIYDFNGDVYPADEARMLARMGDSKFFMGNVFNNTYQEIFYGNTIKDLVRMSCVELMPQCATCPFQIYCGADPVRNYLDHKDLMGHRPSSDFCRKNMAIFRHLFSLLLRNDPKVMDVFWSWITRHQILIEDPECSQQSSHLTD